MSNEYFELDQKLNTALIENARLQSELNKRAFTDARNTILSEENKRLREALEEVAFTCGICSICQGDCDNDCNSHNVTEIEDILNQALEAK